MFIPLSEGGLLQNSFQHTGYVSCDLYLPSQLLLQIWVSLTQIQAYVAQSSLLFPYQHLFPLSAVYQQVSKKWLQFLCPRETEYIF